MGIFDIFKKNKTNTKLYDLNKNKQKSALGLTEEEYEEIKEEARKDADEWLEKNRDRLKKEAMERSEQFSLIHEKALSKIKINALKSIKDTEFINLLPKEILFLNYVNGKCSHNPDIAGYWTHEYKLNYQTVLIKLFKGGYLTFSDYKFNMSKYKVKELKEILSTYDLKLSGKKQELIDRLIENLSEDQLKRIFSTSYFMITDTAKSLLDNNSHIMYFHQHHNQFGLTIDEADNYKNMHPTLNEYEIAIAIISNKSTVHYKSKDYGLYRNDLYGLSIVYKDMKNYHEQIKLLLQVCYIDLSGLHNNNSYNKDYAELAPGIISLLNIAIVDLDMNYQELKEIYNKAILELSIHKHVHSNENAFKLIKDALVEI